MKNRFRNIVVGYIITWLIGIIVVCVLVWRGLGRFQKDYDAQRLLQEQATKGSGMGIEDGRAAPETITLSYDYTRAPLAGLEIIAYSNMQILVDGQPADIEVKEVLENQLLADYSGLTQNVVEQCVYLVKADSYSDITVLDGAGAQIKPVANDYTAGVYIENEELSKKAIALFEQYLRHISKMITMEELQSVMRSSSVAYRAVRDSQKSLEWMIAAREMVFPKEETGNMMMLDDSHMICDVYIDLTKVTENNRTVNESVKYKVLFERVNGSWYIYSFEIIV